MDTPQPTTNTATPFRDYIPSSDNPRSKELAQCDTYQWSANRLAEPFVADWQRKWTEVSNEPYKGITVDGSIIPDLYTLAEGKSEEGLRAPVEAMVATAQELLALDLPPAVRESLSKPVDAIEWRRWLNPEIYAYRHGVRLEEVTDEICEAVHKVLRASLSPVGYEKARGCMRVNQFLGEVVNGVRVLNEKSYNFTLFGTPSVSEPWGWQFHGHHLVLNCFVVSRQMVISPVFMGAEPNVIDEGPHRGTELFVDQESTALGLMQSMDEATVRKVRIFNRLSGPEYPEGRFHRADQRHLGGAFQDNRVVPYEGVKMTSLTEPQQKQVWKLIELGLNFLPRGALAAKIAEIGRHWKETYFCWIGGRAVGDAFYYKVHSPVTMIEFDHHTGVFLTNKEPRPFHIHTLVRTPNGNDYGKELLRQYHARK
ncbi:hypothetical protein FE257_006735 [Aspergillus nanangensis]|uniref:DUF3500 domain-containing protein n=1 Tax=Aspergillus nanangensis TaxID=2582783 RepID=A0AAD4CP23_ASPNN|nr:hypothetical protein FE257_006735 [Aspergillus nanangensis]